MILYFPLTLLGIVLLELGYFRWASHLGIVDKPNLRSSHQVPTIRGGGIIFPIAELIWFCLHGFSLNWFTIGLLLVGVISFLDDVKPRPALLRFLIHTAAISLLFYQVAFFNWPWWLLVPAVVISIGALSAFNFMDGINGITGVYAVVTLGTFQYIHECIEPVHPDRFIWTIILATGVFLFFNFRKQALCFAGDVGSVTLAFIQVFLLLQLIQETRYLGWVLLVLVFGLDSVITIVYRLRRKENIFLPHRTHLYQYLANELGWDHRFVALAYGGCQVLINIMVIIGYQTGRPWLVWTVGLLFTALYLFIRLRVSRSLQSIR